MNTQKKGSFSRWSGNSAEWYEAASKYTRYHEKLKTHIAPYLNPKETCCELACGAGTLARHLAPLTARYIANDIDPSSLEFCSRLQNQEPVANLEFLPGDWRKVLAGKKFDTVIFSYFSAIFTDWDALRQLAEKKIIAVVPRYSPDEIEEKKKAFAARSRFGRTAEEDSPATPAGLPKTRNGAYTDLPDTAAEKISDTPGDTKKNKKADGKKGRSFETMEAIAEFLDERTVSYRLIPLTMEFGQPCATLEEAEEYVRYYYRFEREEELKEFVRLKFQPADCGYYFPKTKNIGIVVIDMTPAKKTEDRFPHHSLQTACKDQT